MFGFHRRDRSLIPVRDMEKAEDKSSVRVEVLEDEEEETYTPRQKRNLTMIYLLFLAEAFMASSLSSQIAVLLPSTTGCMDADTSFLRSILECAYYFGSSAGIFWGCAVDRFGRRQVALMGLSGMLACCVSMGFVTSFPALAVLRFVAGAISSATTISGLAMLADFTQGGSSRTKIVARLPVIAVCGSIGPLASHMWSHAFDGHVHKYFTKYPGLSGQIACATLVFSIATAEAFLLEEVRFRFASCSLEMPTNSFLQTLPKNISKPNDREQHVDCEKAAFLGQSLSNDSEDSLNISIVEALNDEAAAPLPSKIGIVQILTAPTLLILLASFSILSLHSSTFEILLPHIGHRASHNGGMGIPCSWLKPVTMIVQVIAAVRILRMTPFVVKKIGLLPAYRRLSMVFPVLYAIIPLAALGVRAVGAPTIVSAIVSTLSMQMKTTVAGAAKVLVLLLVLSAAPDASSTGTVLGIFSISELFKALAVGVSGISYYLSDDYSVVTVNGALWLGLTVIALVGAFVTRRLRETPRIGADIPEECLVWQDVFDVESEGESGF